MVDFKSELDLFKKPEQALVFTYQFFRQKLDGGYAISSILKATSNVRKDSYFSYYSEATCRRYRGVILNYYTSEFSLSLALAVIKNNKPLQNLSKFFNFYFKFWAWQAKFRTEERPLNPMPLKPVRRRLTRTTPKLASSNFSVATSFLLRFY